MNNFPVLGRLWGYVKQVKKELLIGFALLGILTVAQLSIPMIVAEIIDNQLDPVTGYRSLQAIIFLVIGYIVVGIIQSVFRYYSSMSFMDTANLIAIKIREDLFAHVQRLPMRYFDNISAGKVVSRITNDTNALKVLFQTVLSQIVTSAVYIIAIFFILLFTQPWAVLFIVIPMPILYWILKFYHKRSSVYNDEFRRSLSQINSDINENIKGMEVIRAFNVEDGVQKEFEEISESNYQSGVKIEYLDSFVSFNATQTLSSFNVLIILLLFGYMNIRGNSVFTVGLMYILLDYTQRIYHAAQQILQRLRDIEKSVSAARHIFEIFDMEEEITAEKTKEAINGDVEFKNISFYYKNEDYVLKDINFKVPTGSTISLVGQTGSGKSSIINLLFRFYKEQQGEVLFDGINADEYSLDNLRSNMSIVLQEPFIYKGTLKQNITLGREYSDDEVIRALISVGGENLYNNLDKDIDSMLTEGGSTLSQGEKQIITFARAIIKDPKILVLDEATSSIDSETESFIQMGLKKLKEGRTTFIIAHRLSTIKDSDQILVLSYGNIIERGTHEDLIERGGVYFDMLMKENNAA